MKRMKRKALLSFVSVAALALGVGLAVLNPAPLETAKAETTHTEEVFMVNGASIRYSDPTGIRFTGYVKDDGDLSDNVVGMKVSVDGVEKDFSTASIEGATWQWAKSDVEGYKKFQVAIKNIPETQYATEMTAQAYVDNYTSAEIVTRSVARVANAALAADTLEEKLTTDKITALEEYISETAVSLPFDATEVAISGGSLTWNAVDNAKGYLVQFGDEVRNFPTTGAGLYSVSLKEFAGEVVSITLLPYGDGTAYTYAATPYTTVYDSNKLMVTFDTDGGSEIAAVQVERGTTMAEFYKQKYIPADSGFIFDSWRYNGEKVDVNAVVTEDMTLVAYYKRVDGVEMAESAVNKAFYQSFAAIPANYEAGTSVFVEMEVFVTGKIVSKNVPATDEYYNEYATSSIKWVDTTWSAGGEVNNAVEVASFDKMLDNAGAWIKVGFTATVRNYPVLKTNTEFEAMPMGDGNAVYLFASNFKSAATFNYRNVEITLPDSMPDGVEKTSGSLTQYRQAFAGLSTDYEVGTFVKVEMDVYVTGTMDSASAIKWIDTVYTTDGGEVNNAPVVADYATMSESVGEWLRLEFDATVRNFSVLRLNNQEYNTFDVSSYGNAVYIAATNFTSAESFLYKNVSVSAEKDAVGVSMTAGTQKTSDPNNYYQAFAGLSTDLAAGTGVTVEMDVYVTGTYDQYSDGIRWVDTVYTTDGGEVNASTKIVDVATMNENVGQWIHVSFAATVRNFSVLRANSAYATMDVSSYGNAVYLFAKDFKSADSFNYKNVTITETNKVPTGTQKTSNPNGYYQAFAGISTDLAVGTGVTVEMDVYITGTYDQWSGGIHWVDTVYTTDGGEVNASTQIVSIDTMTANAGKWIHVTFDATVRNFSVLRANSAYATMDVSSYSNAVYLFAKDFKSADSFNYKNVVITEQGADEPDEPTTEGVAMPAGTMKSNGYYQSFVGLTTDLAVGTSVKVSMEIYVTGTVDTAYSASVIKWIDTVYSNNAPNSAPTIVSNATLQEIGGQWYQVEFEATVRNFSVLRGDANFSDIDVSAYGNAVYIIAYQFKSTESFNYKNVVITETMPTGTQKTSPDGFYQSAVGLSTDLAVGSLVKVDMDIRLTGTVNEYSSIIWVDTVWSTSGGEVNAATVIADYVTLSASAGEWIHLSFYAKVRDFDVLSLNSAYPTMDVSNAGNGVFLMAQNFRSAATFDYKNVEITADESVVGVATPNGTEKTSDANGYHQAFLGLPTDYAAGTLVKVEMEVFVTGTYDSNSTIQWVNTVWSVAGGEVNAATTIVDNAMMTANAGQWITLTFDAYVRDFDVLRMNSAYGEEDVSAYGNAVFLMAQNFKSDDSFNCRNARVTAYDVVPDGTEKTSGANGYHQAFVGLSTDYAAGTQVTVEMEVFVTGTYDQYTSINWVDTVYSNNGVYVSTVLVDNAAMTANAGQWITLTFDAVVRDFDELCLGTGYPLVDVSDYGNAVFLMARNFTSVSSFVFRDVSVTAEVTEVEDYAKTYVSNGENIANYSIVVSEDAGKSTQYAATILQARLRQAIGVDVAVITDATEERGLEIILGATNRSETDGIDFNALGEESFQIKNVNSDLVIAGNERGVLYGVYAYLEALGYRFYTVDVEKIPTAEEVFVPTAIELSWEPTFEYRETMYCMTWDAEWAVSQRVNSDFARTELKSDSRYGGFVGYVGGNRWLVHTFSYLLPEGYFTSNPEYFAMVNGSRAVKSGNYYNQPCLTNDGAYQVILNNALAKIASDRKANMISISENDGGEYCHCSTCEESYTQYGVSGTFFRFINKIAGDIGKVYPDVYVDTLSYDMSKEVPENLTIADNVIVRVCPRMCNLCTDPATCEQLAADQARVTAFKAICKNVYVWMYPINWGNLYAAMPNYAEMLNNVRFFAESGVKGVYAEGYSKENPEFGELKAYLMAKLLQNPYMSEAEYEYHYNDFLQGYYGEAAEYIAEYHRLTKEMIDINMKENGHMDKYYDVSENFLFTWDSSTNTYDMTYIDQINDLWEDALNSVSGEQVDHVRKSMIHWTYIELCNTMDNRYTYGTEEEKAELVARNEALYNDIVYYGITRIFDNSHDLIEVTDFTKSPNKDQGDWFNQKWTIGDIL